MTLRTLHPYYPNRYLTLLPYSLPYLLGEEDGLSGTGDALRSVGRRVLEQEDEAVDGSAKEEEVEDE